MSIFEEYGAFKKGHNSQKKIIYFFLQKLSGDLLLNPSTLTKFQGPSLNSYEESQNKRKDIYSPNSYQDTFSPNSYQNIYRQNVPI